MMDGPICPSYDTMMIEPPKTGKATDARAIGTELYLLPISTRMPLKFGPDTLTSVTCARVKLNIKGRNGGVAAGWARRR